MALNKWVGIGRLTATPELKTTAIGVSVTNFTIAVNRPWVQSGERKADFIRIVAWRSSAEFVCKYFEKGDPIQVVGNIQMREYEDSQTGEKKTVFEIMAETVDFVEGYKRIDNAEMPSGFYETEEDDGLPF